MKERPVLFKAEMVRAILENRKTQTRRIIKPQPYTSRQNPPQCRDTEVGDFFICPDLLPTEDLDKPGAVIVECEAIGTYHSMGVQNFVEKHCPFGVPGDQLWVRENWGYRGSGSSHGGGKESTYYNYVTYHADELRSTLYTDKEERNKRDLKQNIKYPDGYDDLPADEQVFIRDELLYKWWDSKKSIPSIHMPRWASRIQLEVTSVGVERVQDITPEDAISEGLTIENFTGFGDEAGLPSFPEPDVFQYFKINGQPDYTESAVDAFHYLWDSINGDRASWDSNPWVWVVEFRRIES